ncbi:hypothetical protein F5X99DRAFT_233909 [Biscogniauxia marginata]|nr:hypothetical protein F5X99DRAFT_233909 [Biscogniauxia marginata]
MGIEMGRWRLSAKGEECRVLNLDCVFYVSLHDSCRLVMILTGSSPARVVARKLRFFPPRRPFLPRHNEAMARISGRGEQSPRRGGIGCGGGGMVPNLMRDGRGLLCAPGEEMKENKMSERGRVENVIVMRNPVEESGSDESDPPAGTSKGSELRSKHGYSGRGGSRLGGDARSLAPRFGDAPRKGPGAVQCKSIARANWGLGSLRSLCACDLYAICSRDHRHWQDGRLVC